MEWTVMGNRSRRSRMIASVVLLSGVMACLLPAHPASAQTLSARYMPIITGFAGSGTASYTGDNGLATAATMNAPWSAIYRATSISPIMETT